MTKKKQKPEMTDEEFEAMRQRALQPFKPSLTDADIKNFEEEVRQRSLESMKRQKEGLNDYDKQKIKDKVDFIHHL